MRIPPPDDLPFVKMHGLGNDFVILRDPPIPLTPTLVQKMAYRREGIGCDQLLVISQKTQAGPLKLDIWNTDGSMAEACGNGTRCAVWLVAQTGDKTESVFFESAAGVLEGWIAGPGEVTVTQGFPREEAAFDLDLSAWHLPCGLAVNLGNPHLVVFVPTVAEIPLETLGPLLENHPAFPNRTNVEFVEIVSNHLKMRVWERGVGVTPACGSGACAAVHAALKKGLLKGPCVPVHLDGGVLEITALPGQPLQQKGPVSFSYQGVWPLLTSPGL